MADYHVGYATEQDIPAIWSLEQKLFSFPIPENRLAPYSGKEDICLFSAKDSDNMFCGFAALTEILDTGELVSIAVTENLRGCGVGSVLLEAVIDKCREDGIEVLTLEVREGNIPAVNLYEKFGFQVEGLRKNYYSDPKEDALIMTKHMK